MTLQTIAGTETGAQLKELLNDNFDELRNSQGSITASTTQTQGQQALTKRFNVVSTCANSNDVVTLPAAATDTECIVVNRGANTLQVFPASGDKINGGTTDASTTIASNAATRFYAIDATGWWTW